MFIDLGVQKFNEIIEALSDCSIVDERSPTNGRQIHITLAPAKAGAKPK
jgi:translation initiation factor IF-3